MADPLTFIPIHCAPMLHALYDDVAQRMDSIAFKKMTAVFAHFQRPKAGCSRWLTVFWICEVFSGTFMPFLRYFCWSYFLFFFPVSSLPRWNFRLFCAVFQEGLYQKFNCGRPAFVFRMPGKRRALRCRKLKKRRRRLRGPKKLRRHHRPFPAQQLTDSWSSLENFLLTPKNSATL